MAPLTNLLNVELVELVVDTLCNPPSKAFFIEILPKAFIIRNNQALDFEVRRENTFLCLTLHLLSHRANLQEMGESQ